MKLKGALGFAMAWIMIFSSLNVSFAENIGEANEILDEAVVEDILLSDKAVDVGGISLYSASSTDTKYEVEGGYIYFDESSGTITDCDTSVTSAVIPSEINGVSVVSIGYEAFRGCSSITSIEIPSSVTSIEGYAFYRCSSITSIKIPSSVTSIGYDAFADCSSLTSIKIPSSVTSIGDSAFGYCNSLTSIEIPSSVTSIGDSVFEYCGRLTSIEIPSSVTSIGYSAFKNCRSLTSIKIPSSVTSIGYDAFAYCSSLTSIEIPSNVTSIGRYAFYNCSSLTSIEIPSGVTSIGDSVFENCSSLRSIEIPSSVTSIGQSAFENCRSLTSIEIPSSVTSIWDHAFEDCSSLTSIEIPSSVTSIWDHAFRDCSSLTSIEIPSSVTSIGEAAFYNCSSLTNIEIPSSVTSIGESAFYNCSSLRSIEIPSSVTYIAYGVFRNCSSLTSIEIPSSVTSIGKYAFSGCSSLRSIEIPSSVTSIGNSAFDNCDKEKLVFYVEKDSYADTWAKDNGWNTSYDTFKDNSYSISSTFIYLDKGTQTEPYKMVVDTEGTIDAVIKTKSDDTAVTINWSSDNTDVIVFTESSNDKGYHILMPVDNPSLNEYYSASGVKFKGKSEGSAVITATAEGWSKSWNIQVVGSDEEIPNKEYYNVEEEEEDLSQLSPEERLLKYSRKYRKSVEDVNDDITRKLKQIKKKNEQNEEKAFKEMLPKIRNMYSENLMLTDDEVYAVEKGIFYYLNTMVSEGEDISGLDLSKNETEIGVNLVKKVYNNLSKDKKTYTIDKYKITISVDISLFGAFSGNISITDTTNPDKYYSPLLFNSDIDTSVAAMRAYCEQLRTLTKNALNYGVNSYIDYFTSSTGLDKFIEDTFKTITLSAFLEEEGFVEAANILLDGYEIYTEVEEVIEKGGLVDRSVLESLKDKGVGDISANDLVNTTYKKLASMRKNVVAAAIDCYEGTNTPSDDPVEKISFFKKLTIKCPVDVYLYDSEGNEIGSIVENVVTEGADNIKIDVENGAKYVYVLDNTDISCKTVGYDYGVLNVTEEQGCNGNIIGREIYYNIPVYPNDVFTKKVDGDSYGTEGNSIYRNGEEITPSECIEATENGAVAIDVTAENGSVDGSGIYVKGNPVALMASADSGYYFAGWYKGDKLVSATSIYKFTAREDVGLEARFEKITDNSGESIGVRANRIDGTSSIVFVSSVDSLDYEEVGFRFEANGKVVERSTDTVYSAIENSKYTLSETGGSYMYGFTITDIADKEAEIRVTPYVVTVDGEKILGEEYVCSLNSLSEATAGLNTDSVISVDKEERLYIREDIINEEKIY